MLGDDNLPGGGEKHWPPEAVEMRSTGQALSGGEGPPSAEEGLADMGQLLFLPEVLLYGPFQSA